MSFSTKTWNVGDVLTAADMNQYVRDALLYLHGDAGVIGLSSSVSLAASGFAFFARLADVSTRVVFASNITGDTTDRLALLASGDLRSGPGGVTALDTVSATRIAAGVPGGGSVSDFMAYQRHPYGNRRHMESGQVVATSLASFGTTNASVTFTDAFAVVSAITTGVSSSGDTGANTPVASISGGCWRSATSTTGFTLYMRNHSNGTLTLVFEWMAEGTD